MPWSLMYDGVANLSGLVNGLCTRVQQVENRAVYVHCRAHKLNLAVQDAMSSSNEIRDVMALIQDLVAFIRGCPNAWHGVLILKRTTRELKKIPAPFLPH